MSQWGTKIVIHGATFIPSLSGTGEPQYPFEPSPPESIIETIVLFDDTGTTPQLAANRLATLKRDLVGMPYSVWLWLIEASDAQGKLLPPPPMAASDRHLTYKRVESLLQNPKSTEGIKP